MQIIIQKIIAFTIDDEILSVIIILGQLVSHYNHKLFYVTAR